MDDFVCQPAAKVNPRIEWDMELILITLIIKTYAVIYLHACIEWDMGLILITLIKTYNDIFTCVKVTVSLCSYINTITRADLDIDIAVC